MGEVRSILCSIEKKLEAEKSQTADPGWRVRRPGIRSPVIFLFHPLFTSGTLSAKPKVAEASGEGVRGCK